MKNRLFSVLLCGTIAFTSVSAQEDIKAFQHLGIGLELFSTTGFGLELATPLNSHFTLRGGISLFPYKFSDKFEMEGASNILNEVDQVINDNPAVKSELANIGITRASEINTSPEVTLSLGLVNGKILLDFYPSKRGAFHLTGGAYIGKSALLGMDVDMNQAVRVFNIMEKHGVIDFLDDPFMDGYDFTVRDLSNVNAALSIKSVKPYLGIGFGRAVPKRRVNVNFELGALFWGTPEITSKNQNIQKFIDAQMEEMGDMSDLLKKFTIYPVMSLKINFKAF